MLHRLPTRPPPRLPRHLLAVLAAGALWLAGCGGGPAPEKTPKEATEHVSSILLAEEPTEACVKRKFENEPNVAAALNIAPDAAPTSGQVDDLKHLLRACIPPAAQAELYAQLTSSAFPSAPPNAVECIRTSLLQLSPADQDTLLVGALSPTKEGLAFAELLTAKLLEPCGIANFLAGDSLGGGSPLVEDPTGSTPASVSGSTLVR